MSAAAAQAAALQVIRNIAEGSTGPNAMRHVAQIARAALARRPDEHELQELAEAAQRDQDLTWDPDHE